MATFEDFQNLDIRIGKIVDVEVLTLGAMDDKNECVLVSPDSSDAIIGSKIY